MFPKVKTDWDNDVVLEDCNGLVASIYEFMDFERPEVARRFAAMCNATRHLSIEQLESDDPLGLAEVCRLQRELCVKAVQFKVTNEHQYVILQAPAPDRKAQQ